MHKLVRGLAKKEFRITPKYGYSNKLDFYRIIDENNEFRKSKLFVKESGVIFYDILRFTDSGNFAISNKVKKILEENDISGWSCFPIEIENYPNERYFAFQLTSKRAGKILNLEALNNYEEDCIKFEKSTWDGSDLFTLDNTATVICTPRIKELFEKEKITNVGFNEVIPV